MPEAFEPVKVEDTGEKIHEFQVNMENIGELGEENNRLNLYMKDQEELVKKHLSAFKEKALDKYTGMLTWDNEEAVNQALRDYADEMNTILKKSVTQLNEIAEKYKDIIDSAETSEAINKHYELVKGEFGQKLDAMIKAHANRNIEGIIDAAEERAEEAEKGGFSGAIKKGGERITGKSREDA
ncbi:hypothetical protein KKA33_03020, partial [Patescibacteria group bacterium]|nr:hypothetical protein [Patescibacteria group bacterium]